MIKMHIISDLVLGFNEFSIEEEQIPDVDLVILNGNLGIIKRAMFYAETLCRKYPDIQFVFNCGETEYHSSPPKFLGELDESISIRKFSNSTWPTNLHWSKEPQLITLRNGIQVDVLCTYGYPFIHGLSIPWEETIWFKNYVMDIVQDTKTLTQGYWKKPETTSDVNHGYGCVFASKEWINAQHEKEWKLVQDWEIKETGLKILVTHINPHNDTRFHGQIVSPYKIHLKDGIWVGSNTPSNGTLFLGANLYSNPGRGMLARQKVISVNL